MKSSGKMGKIVKDQIKYKRRRKNLGTIFSEPDFNTRTILKQDLAVT